MQHKLVPNFPHRQHRRRHLVAAAAVVPAAAATLLALGSTAATAAKRGDHAASSATNALVSTTPAGHRYPGTLIWDLPDGEPTTLDYIKSGDYSPDTMVSNMCDSLLRQNADFGVSPELATSWRYSHHNLTLTYQLRHGVKFWDGKTLTSADVVYSLKRNMSTTNGAIEGGFYQFVSSIVAKGPYAVVVHFKRPDELFNKEMATISGDVSEAAYTKAKGARFGTATGGVMCSGPLEFVSWTPGSQIVLKRNPHYWDPQYEPRANKVIVKFVNDTSSLVSGLESGELAGAYHIPFVTYSALKKSHPDAIRVGRSLEMALLLPVSDSPATDPKIRKALSLVIDRSAIAQGVYHGIGATPSYTLLSPANWDPTGTSVYQAALAKLHIPTRPAPQMAKRLIAGDANASKPITIGVLAGDQLEIETATLIQAEAQGIGLNVKIRELQPLQFSNSFYIPSARRGLSFLFTEGYLDVVDPLDYLRLVATAGGALNEDNYNNPKVTSLLNQAEETFDSHKRAELITQAQAIYHQAQMVIPLESVHALSYLNTKFTGVIPSFGYVYLPNLAEIGLNK